MCYTYIYNQLILHMDDFPIPDEILEKLLSKASKKTTPKEFLEIFNDVKSNPVLKRILSLGEDELEAQIQKLSYATIMLNDAKIMALWEENIKAPGMSLDKLCTIAIWEPEAENLTDGWLTLGQIKAISGEFLAHPDMTVGKITVTWFWATPTQIREIWAQTIIDTPTEDVMMLFF